MFTYTVRYDPTTGNPIGILRSDGLNISIGATGNADWNNFLIWNSQQVVPLDYVDPVITLIQAQTNQLAFVLSQLESVQQAGFSLYLQFNFKLLLDNARLAGNRPNQLAYCQQVFTWLGQCFGVYVTAQNAINAAITVPAVQAIQLGSTPAPPAVNIVTAALMNN